VAQGLKKESLPMGQCAFFLDETSNKNSGGVGKKLKDVLG